MHVQGHMDTQAKLIETVQQRIDSSQSKSHEQNMQVESARLCWFVLIFVLATLVAQGMFVKHLLRNGKDMDMGNHDTAAVAKFFPPTIPGLGSSIVPLFDQQMQWNQNQHQRQQQQQTQWQQQQWQ